MSIWDTTLPHLNPDPNKPNTIKEPLAQLDYYQTYDRAGNKIHCDPILFSGVLIGGFKESHNLDSGILVDRIHPVKKQCFDLLAWAIENSGGGVQLIYKEFNAGQLNEVGVLDF
jgi:hypothetical protein